jgi:hypothetical protein
MFPGRKTSGFPLYPVDIEIYANDRTGLIADILQTIGSAGVSVSDLKAHLVTATMNDVVTLTSRRQFVEDPRGRFFGLCSGSKASTRSTGSSINAFRRCFSLGSPL